MPKEEWGTKRVCPTTGKRFYDLTKTPIVSPYTGEVVTLDTGKGKYDPIKHTISVAPGTTVYTETEVDVTGQWAFHCHLAYHADAGMFRKIVIEGGPA